MAKYKVLLHVSGLALDSHDAQAERIRGCFVTCVVNATDAAEAGLEAIGELRRHPNFQSLRPDKSASERASEPEIRVEELERLGLLDTRPLGITTGFVFYSDEASERMDERADD